MIIFFSTLKCFNLPSPAREMSAALSLTERQYFWQNNDTNSEGWRLQALDSDYLPWDGLAGLQQELLPPVGLVPHPHDDEGGLFTVLDVRNSENFTGSIERHCEAWLEVMREGPRSGQLDVQMSVPLNSALISMFLLTVERSGVEWCEQGSQYLSYIAAFLPSCESFFYLLSSRLAPAWLPPQHKSNLMNNDLLKWARGRLTFI